VMRSYEVTLRVTLGLAWLIAACVGSSPLSNPLMSTNGGWKMAAVLSWSTAVYARTSATCRATFRCAAPDAQHSAGCPRGRETQCFRPS
jgi:hypothetical protein